MRLLAVMFLLNATSACLTPRSIAFQQMASPVGRGVTEVGVFGGVGYAVQTNPPVSTGSGASQVVTQTQLRGLIAPGVEANIQQGFTEHVGLNLHASSAGIQPGLKITVNRSRVAHFAILPAFAVGYASLASSTYQSAAGGSLNEINPGSTTSLSALGGLKLIFSHHSGFYIGAGYDFLLHRVLSSSAPTPNVDRTDTLTLTLSHQLSGAVGFDFTLGRVHLRPEICGAFYPAASVSTLTQVGSTRAEGSVSGGFGWAILPGLGISVASEYVRVAAPPVDEDDARDDDGYDERPAERRNPNSRRPPPEDEDD